MAQKFSVTFYYSPIQAADAKQVRIDSPIGEALDDASYPNTKQEAQLLLGWLTVLTSHKTDPYLNPNRP